MTKITYVTALTEAMSILSALRDGVTHEPALDLSEVIDKMDALKGQLEQRKSATHKPTKVQRENVDLKERILSTLSGMHLTGKESAKCGEIAAALDISGQKCSALLSQLVQSGEVVKTTEKRVTTFALADEDDSAQALPGELDV